MRPSLTSATGEFAIAAPSAYLSAMNPMRTFDPEAACRVHDKLNEQVLIWKPEWADDYRQHAREHDDGVINWNGLLLDGWSPT
jgi:hypothetical protein